ncbi:type II toxin-antitoxin system RelE/ParE family toxin [Sphingomonas sp.]|jgi:toxin ParE1/3/4|uniref:type II toxin-antitoxin system RelE/ParE family toxin n=1 Tax=Sphingomonas sp. TaxID=28214 RepID=UPI002ED78EC0
MAKVRIDDTAAVQIEDIYIYTADHWGEAQAEAYVRGLYDLFQDIADGRATGRMIPATFPVEGYVRTYRSHFVYWRKLEPDVIGIAAVLHGRMHRVERVRKLLGERN